MVRLFSLFRICSTESTSSAIPTNAPIMCTVFEQFRFQIEGAEKFGHRVCWACEYRSNRSVELIRWKIGRERFGFITLKNYTLRNLRQMTLLAIQPAINLIAFPNSVSWCKTNAEINLRFFMHWKIRTKATNCLELKCPSKNLKISTSRQELAEHRQACFDV